MKDINSENQSQDNHHPDDNSFMTDIMETYKQSLQESPSKNDDKTITNRNIPTKQQNDNTIDDNIVKDDMIPKIRYDEVRKFSNQVNAKNHSFQKQYSQNRDKLFSDLNKLADEGALSEDDIDILKSHFSDLKVEDSIEYKDNDSVNKEHDIHPVLKNQNETTTELANYKKYNKEGSADVDKKHNFYYSMLPFLSVDEYDKEIDMLDRMSIEDKLYYVIHKGEEYYDEYYEDLKTHKNFLNYTNFLKTERKALQEENNKLKQNLDKTTKKTYSTSNDKGYTTNNNLYDYLNGKNYR